MEKETPEEYVVEGMVPKSLITGNPEDTELIPQRHIVTHTDPKKMTTPTENTIKMKNIEDGKNYSYDGKNLTETPTEEWEREFDERFGPKNYPYIDGNAGFGELDDLWLDVKDFIKSVRSSHDAELARKIEGMPIRSYNISATQIRQFVDRDAVLALLGNKNV